MLVLAWRSTSVVAAGGSASALHARQEDESDATMRPESIVLASPPLPLLDPELPLLDPELPLLDPELPLLDPELLLLDPELLLSLAVASFEPPSPADEPELPLPPHDAPLAITAARTTSMAIPCCAPGMVFLLLHR
jgi:hypothetical protein